VRHAIRATYVFVVVVVAIVLFHFLLAPFCKACVVVTLPEDNRAITRVKSLRSENHNPPPRGRRRRPESSHHQAESEASGDDDDDDPPRGRRRRRRPSKDERRELRREKSKIKARTRAAVWEEAQKASDAPLLWPRMLWPAFGLLLPILVVGCASPAWGRPSCWRPRNLVQYYSQVVVFLAVLLYTAVVRVHVVSQMNQGRASYSASNVDDDDERYAAPEQQRWRLPRQPFQPVEVFASYWRGIVLGLPLFDEYTIGDWTDSRVAGAASADARSTFFVYSHGAAFEDFVPEHAAYGEWHLIMQDVLLSIGAGVGPLWSGKTQLVVVLLFELYGLLWALYARPYANVGLNVLLLVTKFLQTSVMILLGVATFLLGDNSDKINSLLYWAVVLGEGCILLLTLVLPALNAVSQVLIFAALSCWGSLPPDRDVDGELVFAVSALTALRKGLLGGSQQRNGTSLALAYCLLLRRELCYVTSWFFFLPFSAGERTTSQGPPPREDDDDEDDRESAATHQHDQALEEDSDDGGPKRKNEFDLARSASFLPVESKMPLDAMTEPQLRSFILRNGGTYDDADSILELRLRAEDIFKRDSTGYVLHSTNAEDDDRTPLEVKAGDSLHLEDSFSDPKGGDPVDRMSSGELREFILHHGGTYDDCPRLADLRALARSLADRRRSSAQSEILAVSSV